MILFVLAYQGGGLTIVSPLFFRCCRSCSLERTPRSSAVACHCLLAWLCDFCRGSHAGRVGGGWAVQANDLSASPR